MDPEKKINAKSESSSENVFQKSDFAQSEDIVIIVENSPAFYRDDISPTRFSRFKDLLETFVEDRINLDYRDRYFLMIFNSEILTPIKSFEAFSHQLIEQIEKGFDQTIAIENPTAVDWGKNFLATLQKGIQKSISSFKKIRNKTLRIVIFINQIPGITPNFREKLTQMVERTAQRLDIIIDVVFISGTQKVLIFDYENPIKDICEMTGGKYFHVTKAYEMEEAFREITKKKEVLRKDYLGEREYTQEKEFLEIIASDLERITDVLEDTELKCQICFKKECEHVESYDIMDFYEHLRRCPNCKKILHLCCAGRWAEQQNSKSNFIGFPNVFRCPYCFYLLKVPREFVDFDNVLNQLQEKWLKKKDEEEVKLQEEEEKEKEMKSFFSEVDKLRQEKEKILNWLKHKLPHKNGRELEDTADEIVRIKDKDEKISFINYLKFKEHIDDDSMPI
ncbi:MAG: hypothetical protein EU544_03095 [Promethearchaeota archaeon]|nr:MAG: hypothetical protein EU544_03095 [Candidatus Lokiarchaeota archaeon]